MTFRKLFLFLLCAGIALGTYLVFRPSSSSDVRDDRRRGVTKSVREERRAKDDSESLSIGTGGSVAPKSPRQAGMSQALGADAEEAPPADQGFELLQKGDVTEARSLFEEHVTLYPLDPRGHYGLGVAYRTEESFDDAVEEFVKTLFLDPTQAQAKLQLAEMLTFQMKEDPESAEQLYQEVLEQAPEEKAAMNGLASVYFSTGRVDQAIPVWEKLREELPDQQALSMNLSEAYLLKATNAREAGDAGEAEAWDAKAKALLSK